MLDTARFSRSKELEKLFRFVRALWDRTRGLTDDSLRTTNTRFFNTDYVALVETILARHLPTYYSQSYVARYSPYLLT
jgi:hypothetical protein